MRKPKQLIYKFSQSPTLYWVSSDPGRDSVCMQESLYALAGFPKFLHVDFLVPRVCGHSLTISSVGAGAGAGMSSAGAGTSSTILSLLSKNIESDEVSDFVR